MTKERYRRDAETGSGTALKLMLLDLGIQSMRYSHVNIDITAVTATQDSTLQVTLFHFSAWGLDSRVRNRKAELSRATLGGGKGSTIDRAPRGNT